ncbi:MAG TPA: PIG-L family deacetylase [Armatimonadota bacterium]|nr:PIG-L family deacetylase [Armatimonadota bacterium]
MQFHLPTAGLFVPDGVPPSDALARTTHLCIAAHQDDIEIMAYHGVLTCFGLPDAWFTGVVVTNGSGSPRDDLYASYTDAQMMAVRRVEQRKAAIVGEYGAQVFLDYTSGAVKDPGNAEVAEDIYQLLMATRPRVVYTHNPADKHDTHVGVALRTLAALRRMPGEALPERVLGCEVWRGLDWMQDEEKVALDVSAHESLAAALLGVFDSQICGGKRYDLATIGRRRANATYFASHATDVATQMNFAMDLTPLARDAALDIAVYTQEFIARFADDVGARVRKLA